MEVIDGLQKATRSILRYNQSIHHFPEQQIIASIFVCRILEKHSREQKEMYETQMEGWKLKADHLQNENSKLQNLFQEKSNINETIRHEVSRLSNENSVCYGFICSLIYIKVNEVMALL